MFSLLICVGIAVGVAMLANGNEDSPFFWGIATTVLGIVGSIALGMIGAPMIGALIGSGIGAGVYIAKLAKYG